MSGQLDDRGMKPLPGCARCGERPALWLVVMSKGVTGLGAARWMLCTSCAKATGGRKRALRPRDY